MKYTGESEREAERLQRIWKQELEEAEHKLMIQRLAEHENAERELLTEQYILS